MYWYVTKKEGFVIPFETTPLETLIEYNDEVRGIYEVWEADVEFTEIEYESEPNPPQILIPFFGFPATHPVAQKVKEVGECICMKLWWLVNRETGFVVPFGTHQPSYGEYSSNPEYYELWKTKDLSLTEVNRALGYCGEFDNVGRYPEYKGLPKEHSIAQKVIETGECVAG